MVWPIRPSVTPAIYTGHGVHGSDGLHEPRSTPIRRTSRTRITPSARTALSRRWLAREADGLQDPARAVVEPQAQARDTESDRVERAERGQEEQNVCAVSPVGETQEAHDQRRFDRDGSPEQPLLPAGAAVRLLQCDGD